MCGGGAGQIAFIPSIQRDQTPAESEWWQHGLFHSGGQHTAAYRVQNRDDSDCPEPRCYCLEQSSSIGCLRSRDTEAYGETSNNYCSR